MHSISSVAGWKYILDSIFNIIIRYGRLYVCVYACVCLSVCMSANSSKTNCRIYFLWDDMLSSRDGSHLLFVTLGQR